MLTGLHQRFSEGNSTLSRASASTYVPTQVQQNESAMLAPPVLWQARAARGNLPPHHSSALPSRWPPPRDDIAWKSEAPDTWPPCPGGLAPTLHRPPRQLRLGFPGGAENTPQSDVDCQLGALEARQILRQNLDAPLIVTADAQVHVTQESVELHPCPCLTTHSREHPLGR